jgi:hypothetical protein
MNKCRDCDFTLDADSSMCRNCGLLSPDEGDEDAIHSAHAFDDSDSEFGYIDAYIPGEEYRNDYGKPLRISVKPIKNKIPVLAIISNIVLILAIIGILYFTLSR